MDSPESGALAPYRIENISPVDLVVCPGCRTVVSLADIDTLEVRQLTVEGEGFFSSSRDESVKGVFCPNPGCEVQLFDEDSWVDHLVERRAQSADGGGDDDEEQWDGDDEDEE